MLCKIEVGSGSEVAVNAGHIFWWASGHDTAASRAKKLVILGLQNGSSIPIRVILVYIFCIGHGSLPYAVIT